MFRTFRKFQPKTVHGCLCKTFVTTSDIKLAKSHGDLYKAEKLYNQMVLQHKHKHTNGIDKFTLNCMISVYGGQRKIKDAFSIFNNMTKPDAISFSSIFHACIECKYYAISQNDRKLIHYIDTMSWDIFANHFISNKNNKLLLIDCIQNKITMSAMFDLFINNKNETIKKIKFEEMILKTKSDLLSYYPLPIASFLIHEKQNQNNNKNDHKLNEYLLIHTSNKQYIGINDKLSEKLNATLNFKQKHFNSALERALITFITNYKSADYYAIYLNHSLSHLTEWQFQLDALKKISMQNECTIYIIDGNNLIYQFSNGLCMNKMNENENENKNKNKNKCYETLKLKLKSERDINKIYSLWMDIYFSSEYLKSEMYGIMAQFILNNCKKGNISQNQCVQSINALINDMKCKHIEIKYDEILVLLSSYMLLCANRKHINHKIVTLKNIQNIWQFLSNKSKSENISIRHIHALIYLFGYFEDNKSMKNVFDYFFKLNEINELKPNHEIFHTLLQFETNTETLDYFDINPQNILYSMEKDWNLQPNIVTFNILFSKMNKIDEILKLFHDLNTNINLKPNELTFITLINKVKNKNADSLIIILNKMMELNSNPNTKMLSAIRTSFDALYSNINNKEKEIKTIFNTMYKWTINSKYISFKHFDENLLILLIDCFLYFEQFANIDAIIKKATKKWNCFENIPTKLQRKFIKYKDVKNVKTNDSNNSIIGDIVSIKRTLDWMLTFDDKLLRNACFEMLNQLGQNHNYITDIDTVWSPFCYLFQHLLNKNESNDIFDILEWIRSNVPISSFLLPIYLCIIEDDINNNTFIGFSVSTIPKLRSYQYDKIIKHLPYPLHTQFENFQNRNKILLDEDYKTQMDEIDNYKKWLNANIKTVSLYNLDWRTLVKRNTKQKWISQRSMCRTCWSMFPVHDKLSGDYTAPEPYYSYTLKCAEWQAFTRLTLHYKQYTNLRLE